MAIGILVTQPLAFLGPRKDGGDRANAASKTPQAESSRQPIQID